MYFIIDHDLRLILSLDTDIIGSLARAFTNVHLHRGKPAMKLLPGGVAQRREEIGFEPERLLEPDPVLDLYEFAIDPFNTIQLDLKDLGCIFKAF